MKRTPARFIPAAFGALLAGALGSSCSGSGSAAETILAEEYMPLHTGNEWVYHYEIPGEERLRQSVRVTGTEEHRGHRWAVVMTAVGDRNPPEKTLLRTEGPRLVLYHERLDEEITQVDFSRTTLDSAAMETARVLRRERKVRIAGKDFAQCVDVAGGYADAETATYAPGIGPVEEYWFRGRRELARAVIDGKNVLP